MKKYYQLVSNESNDTADIYIYGDITSWEILENDVSSYTLSKELSTIQAKKINVYINSYGGEVAEGLAIYNALKRHPAEIVTYSDGFAASIASVIFMAGDERVMYDTSLLMVHNAWIETAGDALALRKAADDLETITTASMNAYMEKVSITEEELQELMNKETFITAEEAIKMGFATKIEKSEKGKNATQSSKKKIFEKLIKALQEEDTKTSKDETS